MLRWWISDSRRLGVEAHGVTRAHKWWFLRRMTQIFVLAIFMTGPLLGFWIARGNFASSQLLGLVDLSDPYIFLQSLVGRHWPILPAITGALLIAAIYILVGGRAYCGWVCPVNVVTDAAYWMREKTGLTRDRKLDKRTRLFILAGTLIASALTGTIAWEFLNPVSLLQRAFITGIGIGWVIILAVFLLDLFVARRAWCSHLCPVGAFYGLLGRVSLVRVSARDREACTDCGACFNICPEPHVIVPALKGSGDDTRLILHGDCQNCGGCIDSCPVDVFRMTTRVRP
ncbi:quinol dehydrogenase ferredoxin subunit NapH [Paracoccus aminophilus]|uniref:Methylamine utilization ferredoxin-type protein MauN n=1 Tax=Paracoccus aminophilus JCM 7686 TaxID=1367847 RepID=S5XQE9_PARAH|nr:quinol dehydrogenase ferredoxin subunit NapH [Paracoccus aminophilus]AGT07282.1 methylamine utilization ferredoxin-type protein MauN [Paracoccus aminophilus JCM 7686]